jgi:threonine aldolase
LNAYKPERSDKYIKVKFSQPLAITDGHFSIGFGSDKWAGAHPAIAASLSAHAGDYSTPYGDSTLDQAVQRRMSEIFEHGVTIFYTSTGTASNSLALTSVAKPGGNYIRASRGTYCRR